MPGLGLRAFYDPGQLNGGTCLCEDLRRPSVLVKAGVRSLSTALPATATAGKMFIMPAADCSSLEGRTEGHQAQDFEKDLCGVHRRIGR